MINSDKKGAQVVDFAGHFDSAVLPRVTLRVHVYHALQKKLNADNDLQKM